MRRVSWILSSLLLACSADDGAPAGGTATGSSSGSADSSPTVTTPTDSATMSASDPATGSPTDGGDATAGTTAPADTTAADTTTGGTNVGQGEVRFVALGDAGEGNEAQFAVAEAIRGVCEERGCDFALYLGDNFYDTGVSSTMDEQFEQKFEVPYAALDFPFMITLGNHDYGALANEWAKSQYYIDYSEQSEKWVFPDEYYSFQEEHVHFLSLDTSQIFWSNDLDAQAQFIQQDLAGLQDTWVIMFGHHPYISNGEHGNAGNYEGLGAILGGQSVKDFFDDNVCGKAHVYICGHDHNRQWLAPQCGTEFIVSGGGSKLTEFVHRDDNRTLWEEDQSEGFLWVEIIDNNFTGVFYDRNGVEQYEGSITL